MGKNGEVGEFAGAGVGGGSREGRPGREIRR